MFQNFFGLTAKAKEKIKQWRKDVLFSFGLVFVFLILTLGSGNNIFAFFDGFDSGGGHGPGGYGYGYGYTSEPPENQGVSWNKIFGGDKKESGWKIIKISQGGYLALGTTESSGAGNSDAILIKVDAFGDKQWEKTFGGENTDIGRAIIETRDGGFLLGIESDSFGRGNYDAWIIKLNAQGDKQWEKTFGSASGDSIESIQEISDGGYVLAGWSMGLDAFGDAWLLRIDLNGNKQWEKTFGGSGTEYIYSLVSASDGGYLLSGYTNSWNASCTDGWIVKTDNKGNEEWSRKFGSSGCDEIHAGKRTLDGGYIFTGTYKYDTWLLKINANGNKQWEKTFGGSSSSSIETGWGVEQTLTQGYIIVGSTTQNNGNTDGWLIKTDGRGKEIWNKMYGSSASESFSDVVLGVDTGYAMVGSRYDDVETDTDLWFVKTNSDGNAPLEPEKSCTEDPTQDYCVLWDKTFGGTKNDRFFSQAETEDGGIIFVGMTKDTRTGYKDGWIVKINSLGEKEWERNVAGRYDDELRGVKVLSDGYIVAGYTALSGSGSSVDGWLVKLDSQGFQIWEQRFGGEGKDYFESVELTSDGGFILSGGSNSSEDTDEYLDIWIVKANQYGNMEWEKIWTLNEEWLGYAAEEISGGFMLAGSLVDSYGEDEGTIIITDSNGNLKDADIFGGSGAQRFYDAKELYDGGFILVGSSQPKNGNMDLWIVRMDAKLQKVWEKTISLPEAEYALSVDETNDRGIIVGGISNNSATSLSNGMLLKLDSKGTQEWLRYYGGEKNDILEEVLQHSSGGYIFTGYTTSQGAGAEDGWAIRTDFEGNAP